MLLVHCKPDSQSTHTHGRHVSSDGTKPVSYISPNMKMHPVSSHTPLPVKMDQKPESVRSPRTALYPARSGRKSDPDRPPIQQPCRPLHPHTQATSADRLPHLSPPASSSPSSVRHHMPHSQQPPSLLSHSLTIPNAPHRVGTWISFPQFQKMEFPDTRTQD